MLHPVKAATSFECDGCNHHASFHSLENPAEDAILRKWEAEEKEQKDKTVSRGSEPRKRVKIERTVKTDVDEQATTGAAGKRKRAIKAKPEEQEVLKIVEIVDPTEVEEEGEGMLQRTMALFGADATPNPTRARRTSPAQKPRRGKKVVD